MILQVQKIQIMIQNLQIEFVKEILEDSDLSSMDNLYTSLQNIDIEELGAPLPNTAKAKILNFVGKDRLNKLFDALFVNGVEFLKSYGPYLTSLGKIDSTIKSYTDQLYTDYAGPMGSEIWENLYLEGKAIQANYYDLVLTVNGETFTYTDAILNEDDLEMMSGFAGLIGGVLIMDEDGQFAVELSDNDNVTITFGDFSETRTKAEWDLMQ